MSEPAPGPHGAGQGAGREAPGSTAPAGPAGAPPSRSADFPISVVADADVGEATKQRARELVVRIARHAPRPVIRARVAIRVDHNPALERPAVAKASLDVGNRHVRAHVAAARPREAVDLLEQRLRRNLESVEELRRAHRRETGAEPPGEWRRSTLPTDRPEHFARPPEERELIRRKTFALAPQTPEEAALEMEALDHDFHLFTSSETNEENVVYRRPDGALALAQVTPGPDAGAGGLPVDPAPAAVLALGDAVERLTLSGERFVFFVDDVTRRGNLLYIRYDGHYGLIEPADV
jgi:ribosome-associated translation inhibitor RaiA